MTRKADAQGELSKAQRGAETSKIDILRRQAYAELLHEKVIGTTSEKMQNFLTNEASFGTVETGEAKQVDIRVSRMLERRARQSDPGHVPSFDLRSFNLLGKSWEDQYNEVIEQLEKKKKGAAFNDRAEVAPSAPVGQTPQAANDTSKIEKHLERQTALLEKADLRNTRTRMLPIGVFVGAGANRV